MEKKTCLLLCAAFTCASPHVQAYCSAPSIFSQPPTAPGTYGRPSVPMCLSNYEISGQHTCSNWEINNYIDDVNSYVRELSDYAEDAQRFANDAATFADDALVYAECEAAAAKESIN